MNTSANLYLEITVVMSEQSLYVPSADQTFQQRNYQFFVDQHQLTGARYITHHTWNHTMHGLYTLSHVKDNEK